MLVSIMEILNDAEKENIMKQNLAKIGTLVILMLFCGYLSRTRHCRSSYCSVGIVVNYDSKASFWLIHIWRSHFFLLHSHPRHISEKEPMNKRHITQSRHKHSIQNTISAYGASIDMNIWMEHVVSIKPNPQCAPCVLFHYFCLSFLVVYLLPRTKKRRHVQFLLSEKKCHFA